MQMISSTSCVFNNRFVFKAIQMKKIGRRSCNSLELWTVKMADTESSKTNVYIHNSFVDILLLVGLDDNTGLITSKQVQETFISSPLTCF